MSFVVQRCLTLIAALVIVCPAGIAPGEDQRSPARLQLTVKRPGWTALELETGIAVPLELAVKPLADAKAYETEIHDGECRLIITLAENASMEEVIRQLQSAIGHLNAFDLKPEEVIVEQVYSDRDAVWVVFKPPELEEKSTIASANDLNSKLERITHVGKVTSFGIPRRVIEVTIDANRTRAYMISAQRIYDVIKRHVSGERPGLTPESSPTRLALSFTELSENLPDLSLAEVNGESIRLRDVAKVNEANMLPSEAWRDRDRVIAFEVRPNNGDVHELRTNIEKNRADWIKDLNPDGAGIELTVIKPELRVELVLPSGVKRRQLDRIAEVAITHLRERLTNPVDVLLIRTSPDSNLLQLDLQRSNPDDPAEISSPAVREALADIPGVLVRVTDLRKKTDDFIELRIFGPDLDLLQNAAKQASAQLRKIGEVVEVRTDGVGSKPELSLQIDREAAAKLGVKTADIASSVGLMMSADGPADLLEVGVRLRFPQESLNAESLGKMLIPAGDDRMIPLSTVADLQLRQIPQVIKHRNGSRMVKLIVQTNSKSERERIVQAVRAIGDNLRSGLSDKKYWIEVE